MQAHIDVMLAWKCLKLQLFCYLTQESTSFNRLPLDTICRMSNGNNLRTLALRRRRWKCFQLHVFNRSTTNIDLAKLTRTPHQCTYKWTTALSRCSLDTFTCLGQWLVHTRTPPQLCRSLFMHDFVLPVIATVISFKSAPGAWIVNCASFPTDAVRN